MRIIIAGGTGFIGQALTKHCLAVGYAVTIISRSQAKIRTRFGSSVTAITWAELSNNNLDILQKAQAVINLTGANIGAKPWSAKRRQELFQSRLQPTQQLAELCARLGTAAPTLLNAGGVGIYGAQLPVPHGLPPAYDEQTPLPTRQPLSLLAQLGQAWEAATQPAKVAGVRVVNMRFGVVLAKQGGALPRLLLPFRLFLGGRVGSGQQPFPWIALPDLLPAIAFLINHPDIHGAVNLIAPQGITQQQFAQAVGRTLRRPSCFPTPAFLIKGLLGQMGEELLLQGQHVVPKVLLNAGFVFQYPTIESALTALLSDDHEH